MLDFTNQFQMGDIGLSDFGIEEGAFRPPRDYWNEVHAGT